MARGKSKVDPRLFDLVKKYMQRARQNFSTIKPAQIVDDLMTLSEYERLSRPKLLKDVQRAYDFQLLKEGKIPHKSKEISGVSSDDENDVDVPNVDPDINVSKLMKFAKPVQQKVCKKSAEPSKNVETLSDNDHSEDQVSRKRKRSMDQELSDVKHSKLKRFKKLFKLQEPDDPILFMQGMKNEVEIMEFVSEALWKKTFDFRAADSWLLVGPSGSGKTSLLNQLASKSGSQILSVFATDLIGGAGERTSMIKDAFEYAKLSSPCILHIDKLDKAFPNSHLYLRPIEKKLCSQLKTELSKLRGAGDQVLVVAEVNSPNNLDVALRHSFAQESYMYHLTVTDRTKILKSICQDKGNKFDIDYDAVAMQAYGFFGGDLKKAIEKAITFAEDEEIASFHVGKSHEENMLLFQNYVHSAESKEKPPAIVTMKHMLKALENVVPDLKQGFPLVPKITMSDVGGLVNVKERIQKCILNPIKHRKLYQCAGTRLPTHILLWGPPGCGKTMVAKALANQAGINFMSVQNSDILNMYQGESERAIRNVFERASKVPPCLIFFDELDAICSRRSKNNDSGSKASIVNSLLVAMDGFNKAGEVYIIGATNRPHALDPSILRPGRFQTIIHVDLPDKDSRFSILQVSSKSLCKDLADDVNLQEIAAKTEGFSGADCAAICSGAYSSACFEMIQSKSNSQLTIADSTATKLTLKELDSPVTSQRHFLNTLKEMAPSVSLEDRKRYAKFKRKFESHKMGMKWKGNVDIFEEVIENGETVDEPILEIPTTPNCNMSMSLL